jgi:hypothetical protein
MTESLPKGRLHKTQRPKNWKKARCRGQFEVLQMRHWSRMPLQSKRLRLRGKQKGELRKPLIPHLLVEEAMQLIGARTSSSSDI